MVGLLRNSPIIIYVIYDIKLNSFMKKKTNSNISLDTSYGPKEKNNPIAVKNSNE